MVEEYKLDTAVMLFCCLVDVVLCVCVCLSVSVCLDATTRAIETSHAKPAAPDVLAPAEPRNGAIERYYYFASKRIALLGKWLFHGIIILLPFP